MTLDSGERFYLFKASPAGSLVSLNAYPEERERALIRPERGVDDYTPRVVLIDPNRIVVAELLYEAPGPARPALGSLAEFLHLGSNVDTVRLRLVFVARRHGHEGYLPATGSTVTVWVKLGKIVARSSAPSRPFVPATTVSTWLSRVIRSLAPHRARTLGSLRVKCSTS